MEFSFFGLPFLLCGSVIPFRTMAFAECFSWKWLWILPAFLLARCSGMLFNQWTDAQFDGLNPRTAQRAIPSGRLSPRPVIMFAWMFLLMFLAMSMWFGPLCGACALLACVFIALYAYCKRVSWGCHFVLGAIHALSPIMASVVIAGQWVSASCWIGMTAGCVIVSNDLLYAIQDEAFDRAHRLHSAPVRWGFDPTLRLAKILSLLGGTSLLGLAVWGPLHPIMFVATPIFCLCALHFQHKIRHCLLDPEQIHQVSILFGRSNVVLGMIVLSFVVLGVIL